MSDERRTVIGAEAESSASWRHEDERLPEWRSEDALWSSRAGKVLRRHPDPYRLAAAWMLGTLPEPEKIVVRAGARHPAWRRLLEDLDRPETAADFRELIDLAQCLVSGRDDEAEGDHWTRLPDTPPNSFPARVRAWLADRELAVASTDADWAIALWRELAGAETVRIFFRLRARLERLRTAATHPSAAEQCALHDYPNLVQREPGHEYAFCLSGCVFVIRRLRGWCRRSCLALNGSLVARLAGWKGEEGRQVMDLLGCFDPAPESEPRKPEESGAELQVRLPILLVTVDPAARKYVKTIAGRARTSISNDVRPFDRPHDIRDERLRAAANPCVVVVPNPDDDPARLVVDLCQRLNQPRVIVLLRDDDPARAWNLLGQGAYDVSLYPGGSVTHLREAIGQAANGAWRRPYVPIFPDTREYNPASDIRNWAFICPEEVAGRTNRQDYFSVLRDLLPRCLGLNENAVVLEQARLLQQAAGKADPEKDKGKHLPFQEVNPGSLTIDLPDVIFALLSADPREEHDRAAFLADMQTLEDRGPRVVYLQRRGAALRLDLPDMRRSWRPILRYHSATELLLRLAFGFGATPPEPDALPELFDHDAAHRPHRDD